MADISLNAGVDVKLDASGNGRASIGPAFGPATWHVTATSVRTSQPGQGNIPLCAIYRGTEDSAGYLDTTYDGSADVCDIAYDLTPGINVIAVWTGGNPGDIATLGVTGTKE